MDTNKERKALVAEIELFIAEAMKAYVIERWADSYQNTKPFAYVINDKNEVWWMKAQAHQLWKMWQAAKAQAVPEWAVIVPKLSANYLFNTVPELGFEHQDQKDTVLYHLNYMASEFRDSAKQFVEDDHAKQKAMIEAQEQKE